MYNDDNDQEEEDVEDESDEEIEQRPKNQKPKTITPPLLVDEPEMVCLPTPQPLYMTPSQTPTLKTDNRRQKSATPERRQKSATPERRQKSATPERRQKSATPERRQKPATPDPVKVRDPLFGSETSEKPPIPRDLRTFPPPKVVRPFQMTGDVLESDDEPIVSNFLLKGILQY